MPGWKNKSSGKSSNLPASISNIRTNFETGEKKLKFLIRPTSSRPGPILLIVAATAVKLVIRSCSSNDTKKLSTLNEN